MPSKHFATKNKRSAASTRKRTRTVEQPKRDKLTLQKIRQLYHPSRQAIQDSFSAFTFRAMDVSNTFQANDLTLGLFQPQANKLVGTLAGILLQQIPSPRNARGGLPQRGTSQKKRDNKQHKRAKQFHELKKIHRPAGGTLQLKVSKKKPVHPTCQNPN